MGEEGEGNMSEVGYKLAVNETCKIRDNCHHKKNGWSLWGGGREGGAKGRGKYELTARQVMIN